MSVAVSLYPDGDYRVIGQWCRCDIYEKHSCVTQKSRIYLEVSSRSFEGTQRIKILFATA